MHVPVAKLLGAAMAISTVICVFHMSSSQTVHFYTLIHWPSAAIVLGGTLGILLVWQPAVRWRGFLAFVNQLSSKAKRPRTVLRKRALAGFLTAGRRAALCAGLGGELLGVVMILTSGTSPAAMEPGISIACVSLLYGLLLSELVFRRDNWGMCYSHLIMAGASTECESGQTSMANQFYLF